AHAQSQYQAQCHRQQGGRGLCRIAALVDVNIRLGPGVAYARDSFVLKGETAVVLGHHSESGWWKIVCPERADGNVCWVSGGSQYTSVSNAGVAESLVAPPTPIVEPTAEATAVSDSSASSSAADSTESEGETANSAMLVVSSPARMVYADDGALWTLLIADTDRVEPVRLVDAEDVVRILISPNGRYAAYVTQENSDSTLHVVELETGAAQTLVDPADLAVMVTDEALIVVMGQVQWLSDSQSLAFNTYAIDRAGGPGLGSLEDLWTVDLVGTLNGRFPAGEGGGSFAISADDVVIMGQTTAVIRANLDGSKRETVITFDFVNTASEFAFYPWLQWTERGVFATAAISSPEPYTSATADLWRIPVTGKAESLSTLEGNVIFSPIIWSDSGRQLGYIRELMGQDAALIIGTGDGETMISYADNANRFFAWSPAESHFVYAGRGAYAIGQVGVEPLIVDMAEGRTAVSAQWLNDDAFIIALGNAGNWDFRLQTIDGPATRLVSGSSSPVYDIWSP
ncbi:MAG: hypothetical protein GWP17_05500, partial [Aquificales bacterium]|nr:hypothetical protein [Aquificales bacterium]